MTITTEKQNLTTTNAPFEIAERMILAAHPGAQVTRRCYGNGYWANLWLDNGVTVTYDAMELALKAGLQ